LLSRPPTSGLTLLNTTHISGCWCGPSFFIGPYGTGRVVTSQGKFLHTWHVNSPPSLSLAGTSTVTTGQDPGFFTSVSSKSSDGTPYGKAASGTAIIWAVGRPTSTTAVNLFAFAALSSGGTYKLLFSSPAGSWPNTGGNANIVPVVANGKVYVAANKALTIFGVPIGLAPVPPPPAAPAAPVASLDSPHVISGTLLAVDGTTLTLRTRTGESVKIDDSLAAKNGQIGTPLGVGVPLTAQGSLFNAIGLLADSIVRAKGSTSELLPPDIL
jgi:hypothetical protein